MSCSRCQDLMVRIDLEDAGSSTYCLSGWQRLLCGEVTGAGIKANRECHQAPMGNWIHPQGT